MSKDAAVKEAVKSTIKPEIQKLADALTKEMTFDKKTGIISVDAGTYVKLMPADLTKDMAEKVQAYNNQLVAAGALAVGTMAIPVMKKDENLDKVTMVVPMIGKDYAGFAFDRSRQVPSRDADNNPNGTKTKFGSTSVEMVAYGTKTRGQLSNVKTLLGELAAEAFGK